MERMGGGNLCGWIGWEEESNKDGKSEGVRIEWMGGGKES